MDDQLVVGISPLFFLFFILIVLLMALLVTITFA
jgi:hypothetical protein